MDRCQSNVDSAAQRAASCCTRAIGFLFSRFVLQHLALTAIGCLVLSSVATDLFAAKQSLQRPNKASTSDAARREAIQAVPLKRIHQKYRRSVQKVLIDSSLFRRMPTQMVDCDPQMFTFLMKNPEMLVEMWQHMGISRVTLKRTGTNTFSLADGAGTTGKLIIVEQKCDGQAQNRIVMYSEGAYEGKPFKRPVRAQCVLLLRSGSMKETNGRDYVACRLDSFVRIERQSVELFAKALHPWVGKTADANFADTISFISNLSQAAEQRPASIERLVNSLPRVTQQRQQKFVRIAYECAEKYDHESAPRVARKAQ
ncbi:MAG: hypothetical protein GXP24_14950 [Planctomycetes bacterium]|nr:hypothetical protein [Planctomycetota bacterium]